MDQTNIFQRKLFFSMLNILQRQYYEIIDQPRNFEMNELDKMVWHSSSLLLSIFSIIENSGKIWIQTCIDKQGKRYKDLKKCAMGRDLFGKSIIKAQRFELNL